MFICLFCCEVFVVTVAALDLAEIFLGDTFFHFSFMVFSIKLLADDGANWVHLSGFGSGSGACLSALDGGFFGLIHCGTLGSLQTM